MSILGCGYFAQYTQKFFEKDVNQRNKHSIIMNCLPGLFKGKVIGKNRYYICMMIRLPANNLALFACCHTQGKEELNNSHFHKLLPLTGCIKGKCLGSYGRVQRWWADGEVNSIMPHGSICGG